MTDTKEQKLTITINSFSYKRGIPKDESGNGGGFVFDCRSILNPGRYEPYKKLTGRDQHVIDFLKNESNIDEFLKPIFILTEGAVKKYMYRNFTHLMISFGCTGGQHRSVYSADALAKHLGENYEVDIKLNHVEQELKNWINETY